MRHHERHRIILLATFLLALVPAMAQTQATPGATPGGTPGATPLTAPGPPRYPDLVAVPPEDLYLSTELMDDGQEHLLLRFSTITANVGDGPLELVGDARAPSGQMVTQLIYDGADGGNVVAEHPLAIDLILHPQHRHFHLDHFATYELLQVDGETLIPTGQGGKQSSCVLDSERIDDTASDVKRYTQCELDRQGLSVGWADRYSASLPNQWIDLGEGPMADGDYVLRYAVDPLGQLQEDGRTANNVAETRFTVRDGVLVGMPVPPRCALDGPDIGSPGMEVALRCSHFPDNAPVMVYWGEWDPWATDARPIEVVRGQGLMAFDVQVTIPDVAPGAWVITLVAWDTERGGNVSATVIVYVEPAPPATPGASPVATPDPVS